MSRLRVSTTVDEKLLREARLLGIAKRDSELLDQALRALLSQNRAVEIDRQYTAYETHPVDEGDEWGDLESFRRAAGSS